MTYYSTGTPIPTVTPIPFGCDINCASDVVSCSYCNTNVVTPLPPVSPVPPTDSEDMNNVCEELDILQNHINELNDTAHTLFTAANILYRDAEQLSYDVKRLSKLIKD